MCKHGSPQNKQTNHGNNPLSQLSQTTTFLNVWGFFLPLISENIDGYHSSSRQEKGTWRIAFAIEALL